MLKKTIFLCAAVVAFAAQAEDKVWSRLTDTLHLKAEMTATGSHGDFAPYWMSNNRYGVASAGTKWASMRIGLNRDQHDDLGRKWQVGYGLEMAPVFQKQDSRFVVQQAYVDVQYKRVRLSVGAKERLSELKNQLLSSGGLASGINARPIPQVRLEVPDFWTIPGTGNWLAIKGRLGYGLYTDNQWQREFVRDGAAYTKNTLYHTKAGWLRIGNDEKFPLSFTAGLEMNTQFGGTRYVKGQPDKTLKLKSDLGAFWHVLVLSGDDPTDGIYSNEMGNVTGSWHFSLDYKGNGWGARGYAEHYFEDHSQVFVQYGWKDMLWGLELNLPKNPVVSDVVYEYLYTKHQSGPIYHDRTANIPDQVSAKDGYWGHGTYGAWQHAGFVNGSGLIISPIYNDGVITVHHNRVKAHHFGIMGHPADELGYRILYSHQRSWGTYSAPLIDTQHGWTLYMQALYQPRYLKDFTFGLAYGHNSGQLLGRSNGVQLSVVWNRAFKKK
ncbi:MAG: hypothetical protein J6129_03500 [Bacteroidaceae bacterium]|nr:hypothetical protein [Bacteroidaceae bacterium]